MVFVPREKSTAWYKEKYLGGSGQRIAALKSIENIDKQKPLSVFTGFILVMTLPKNYNNCIDTRFQRKKGCLLPNDGTFDLVNGT